MRRVGDLSSGYTIIEVMIFLAISGVIFIFAVIFVSGKQNQVEFSQGMANIKIQLQQVVDDAVNGSFSEPANFSCKDGGVSSGRETLLFLNNAANQGSNGQCMFIGYGVQFDVYGTNSNGYAIVPVAISRLSGNNLPISSLKDAVPTPLTADQYGTGTNGVDLVRSGSLGYGIQVTKMFSINNNNSPPKYTPIDGFAVFDNITSNSQYSSSSSNSQPASLYSTTLTVPAPTEENTSLSSIAPFSYYITQIGAGDALTNNDQILICFQGAGSSSEKASIVLGSSNNQMAVTMHLIDGVSAQCL